MKMIKLLLIFFAVSPVQLIFSQNAVSYSPANTTVTVNSGVEVSVPITVSSSVNNLSILNVQPSNICSSTDGYKGIEFTNGLTAIMPGQSTIIKFKFKMNVVEDTTVIYKFTNNSCTSPQVIITVKYKYVISVPPDVFCNLPAPTNVISSNIQTNSASFSWNPVPGAAEYYVQLNNLVTMVDWKDVTNTNVNFWGLKSGTDYRVRIVANCQNQNGNNYSAWEYFTTVCDTLLTAPTNVSATAAGNIYTINFTSIPNYSGNYTLEYINLSNNYTGTQTAYPGMYFNSPPNSFKFRIVPNGCPAPASSWITINPTACPANNYPTNLYVYSQCGSSAPPSACGGIFQWTPPSGSSVCQIEYVIFNASGQTITGSLSASSSITLSQSVNSSQGPWFVKYKAKSKCISLGTWSDFSPWSPNYPW